MCVFTTRKLLWLVEFQMRVHSNENSISIHKNGWIKQITRMYIYGYCQIWWEQECVDKNSYTTNSSWKPEETIITKHKHTIKSDWKEIIKDEWEKRTNNHRLSHRHVHYVVLHKNSKPQLTILKPKKTHSLTTCKQNRNNNGIILIFISCLDLNIKSQLMFSSYCSAIVM